ncbi:MAG: hypothetical protein WC676_05730 [Candidatus Omnitrophota bacterium]
MQIFLKSKIIFIAAFSLAFYGCVGIGAPILDPWTNSQNVDGLLAHNRPLPAELLIEATMENCKRKNDELGLALAYKMFANFLESSTVKNWEYHYRRDGFIIDKTVTFDNRLDKAREYWYKSLHLYQKNNAHAEESNIYVNIATSDFFIKNDPQTACQNLDLSLEAHVKFRKDHPDKPIIMDKRFKDFPDYIKAAKEQFECK